MIDDPVRIDGGLVSGVTEEGGTVRAFKGIPFAAPPVGDLRWRAPQPVAAWDGVRPADRFGPACPQPPVPSNSLMSLFSFDDPPECAISEDCLYLNVWTGAADIDERRPVIVWIHGGAHLLGSGSHPVSCGTHLAARGLVVVTFNYRLGALGYLAHPELSREGGASGNYACLDILAALRWVRDNIAAFGGDPERVTIFGHSAGAQLAAVKMAAPRAEGLFHRVIGTGGGLFAGGMFAHPMLDLATAEAAGEAFLNALGAVTPDQMRQLPAERMFGQIGQWAPIVDGDVLPASVEQVFSSGRQAAVPLMTGFTRDEAVVLPFYEPGNLTGFAAMARSHYGDDADTLLGLYPATNDEEARAQGYLLRRDAGFALQAWRWALLHADGRYAPVFLYYFGQEIPLSPMNRFREPVPPGGYGAWHGADLWYVFDTLNTRSFAWSEADRVLADAIAHAFVRFAASGDPGGGWPRFTSEARQAALFEDGGMRTGQVPNDAQLDFFARRQVEQAATKKVLP